LPLRGVQDKNRRFSCGNHQHEKAGKLECLICQPGGTPNKIGYNLDDLRAGRVPERELYATISRLGKEKIYEAQPDIERFLLSPDENLRGEALNVLALYWQLEAHRATAVEMVQNDPAESVRSNAALILGNAYRNTQDMNVLHILAHIVRNTQEDYYVRRSAYAAMRSIFAYNPQEIIRISLRPSTPFDLEKDVDWAFVDQYADEQK
jgi:HEAT repeat protein